jgi:hypothetical protein
LELLRLKLFPIFPIFSFVLDQVQVRLGEYDFDQQGETGDQTYTLEYMRMHEAYNNKTFENDIAILKTSQPVRFSQSVQPACLPASRGINYENEVATVTGWGTIYFGGPTSAKLKEANVQIWTNNQCATNYNKLKRTVLSTMLCAGDINQRGEVDACQVFI